MTELFPDCVDNTTERHRACDSPQVQAKRTIRRDCRRFGGGFLDTELVLWEQLTGKSYCAKPSLGVADSTSSSQHRNTPILLEQRRNLGMTPPLQAMGPSMKEYSLQSTFPNGNGKHVVNGSGGKIPYR
ncbi:dnaJ-like protein subfamily B member 4 [Platysternon megacephalum]|uniref:DnaJ-like protein subfamily B member 4 n=1 Tax=Platysternon megacephalum TaxID=55544 RepID=A0A4D9EM74_9SAUR|nr:dnaJ-like protein subfamily B member 4 [Platysternon megacephalum]